MTWGFQAGFCWKRHVWQAFAPTCCQVDVREMKRALGWDPVHGCTRLNACRASKSVAESLSSALLKCGLPMSPCSCVGYFIQACSYQDDSEAALWQTVSTFLF